MRLSSLSLDYGGGYTLGCGEESATDETGSYYYEITKVDGDDSSVENGDCAVSGKYTRVEKVEVTVCIKDDGTFEVGSGEVSLGATLELAGYLMSGTISVTCSTTGTTVSVSIDGGEAATADSYAVTESTESVVVTVTGITEAGNVSIKVKGADESDTEKEFTVSQDDLGGTEGAYTATLALRGSERFGKNYAQNQSKTRVMSRNKIRKI